MKIKGGIKSAVKISYGFKNLMKLGVENINFKITIARTVFKFSFKISVFVRLGALFGTFFGNFLSFFFLCRRELRFSSEEKF